MAGGECRARADHRGEQFPGPEAGADVRKVWADVAPVFEYGVAAGTLRRTVPVEDVPALARVTAGECGSHQAQVVLFRQRLFVSRQFFGDARFRAVLGDGNQVEVKRRGQFAAG